MNYTLLKEQGNLTPCWPGSSMRAAVIQMRSGTCISANIAEMERLVIAATKDGAQYIQTPEMTGILQKSPKDLFAEIKSPNEDALLKAAAKLAEKLKIWLHIGSHAVRLNDQKAANRAFVFAPDGNTAGTYDKIHMFDVDLDNGESWRESRVYQPGTKACLVQLPNTMLGVSICYDVRFPHLYRELSVSGAGVLAAPAAFTRQTGEAHWHILMRARAIENGAFVVAAAQGGNHEDGRETFGHSLIVDPWGMIIAELANEEPGFAVADLDLSLVAKARAKIPNLANTREFVLEDGSKDYEAVA